MAHDKSDAGAFDPAEFVTNLRHAACRVRQLGYSSIDNCTARHEAYALSIRHRKRIEEALGWTKTVAGMVQTVHRGVERVRFCFIMTMAAANLARLPAA